MKKIERLYGVKLAIWKCMNYHHALDKPFKEVTNDDTRRINECLRAIKFNEELLNE